ncbi:MAG: NAD(P)H-dependent oxidoreductase [Candidatus Woesearchaeota archaeon]|nr:NAD(P)H-dependent oxidoreductase [Candidatus Woesearchaeota archaeon]
MEFKDIVMKRYAAKKFDGKAVPQKKIDELLELIRFAPSSFNLQTWKVKIVTDKVTKEKLKAAAWNQEQITTCSHLLVFCANTDVLGNIDHLEKTMLGNGATHEQIKGYVNMMRGFEEGMSAERKLTWAQKQCYIALGNAMNGATSLGLDSCPMEGFSPEQFAQILDLPKGLVPTVICPIGYAADSPMPKLRFKKEELFF